MQLYYEVGCYMLMLKSVKCNVRHKVSMYLKGLGAGGLVGIYPNP